MSQPGEFQRSDCQPRNAVEGINYFWKTTFHFTTLNLRGCFITYRFCVSFARDLVPVKHSFTFAADSY